MISSFFSHIINEYDYSRPLYGTKIRCKYFANSGHKVVGRIYVNLKAPVEFLWHMGISGYKSTEITRFISWNAQISQKFYRIFKIYINSSDHFVPAICRIFTPEMLVVWLSSLRKT